MTAAAQPRASARVLLVDDLHAPMEPLSGSSQSPSVAPPPPGAGGWGGSDRESLTRRARAQSRPSASATDGVEPRASRSRSAGAVLQKMLAARSDAPRRARRERDEAIRSVPCIAPYVKSSLWMSANCVNRAASACRRRRRRGATGTHSAAAAGLRVMARADQASGQARQAGEADQAGEATGSAISRRGESGGRRERPGDQAGEATGSRSRATSCARSRRRRSSSRSASAALSVIAPASSTAPLWTTQ